MAENKYVMVQAVDMRGVSRGKIIPASEQRAAQEYGVGFGAAALYGMGLGPETPELLARIAPTTATRLPWDQTITRFAASIFSDGRPHEYCPRNVLQKVIAQAEKDGYRLMIGVEPEHHLVIQDEQGNIKPWDPHHNEVGDRLAFSLRMTIASTSYMTTVMQWLDTLGWGCFVAEKEEGPAQYEINWKHADALTTTDRLAFFKLLANKAAEDLGAKATFMAKPFPDRTGSGLHFHCHLENLDGENLFLDPNEQFGLSIIGKHFIAGVMHRASALCAVTNPTVNCYQRLHARNEDTKSGCTWAPHRVTWGGNNRTVMTRVPAPGRIEDRSPSPNCNPYLAIACYLSAGLDGIKKSMVPEGPVLGNTYTMVGFKGKILPEKLQDAAKALIEDEVLLDTLGPLHKELVVWQHEQASQFSGHRETFPQTMYDQFLQLF